MVSGHLKFQYVMSPVALISTRIGVIVFSLVLFENILKDIYWTELRSHAYF